MKSIVVVILLIALGLGVHADFRELFSCEARVIRKGIEIEVRLLPRL
jgi:hypothetical protein